MKKLLLTLLAVALTTTMQAQRVSLRTNVTADLLMTPSLGAEMTVGERSTLSLNAFGNYKPWGWDMKMFAVQPEYRYYFSGRPMHSFFAGIGAIAGFYDLTFKGKVYDGIAYGGGVTFGYVLNINKRINVDFHAGCGAVGYDRKEYYKGDNYNHDYVVNGKVKTNSKGYYIMPTNIGVSFAYIIW